MKKHYLPLLAILLAVFACQKPASNPGPGTGGSTQKFAVNFKVSGFSQVIAGNNARSADTSVLQNVQQLIYVVFDANTKAIVSEQTRTVGDTTFGEFRDSLPVGRYVVTVTGIKDTTGAYRSAFDPPGVALTQQGSDVFYKRAIISVNNSVDANMELDRVVSKLVYQFKGRVPFNAKTVSIWPYIAEDPYALSSFLDFYSGTNMMSQHFIYDRYAYSIPDSLVGREGLTVNTYMMNPTGPISADITITVMDAANNTIGGRGINSVILKNNQTTLLSGYLFDSIPAGGGVQVIVNPNWGIDTIKVDF
ncbi:hypothetical protein FHW36_104364 [Chitinophaga polysaccharea]|uniref:Fimbrillin-A associated anchor protein Mfa1/Mfa2 n=1 Tax=Chitinophaga polysaccharea TaxID=1293035 RepID=A0A561PRF7_9BACT|nr:hypothetical protein [Chitinophaga polysaccharea]TWF40681.1 hypothetical protein FHW36_104364 [Chitinophaga polysaccharea]